MPIYEEKLISPLAIRFTQQRIRKTFRDGREVEATIKQVTARPGVGDYDIILSAPFPTIEIIRWSPNGRSSGGKEHWFSFDNRRLYCLQRLAALHWPKRVGAKVEVLYADDGTIRKKLDSQTCGVSVSIGHAFATAGELEEWSWQQAVQDLPLPDLNSAVRAETAVLTDDAKTNVRELTDAPGEQSAVDRLFQAEMYKPPASESSASQEEESIDKHETISAAEVQPRDSSLTNLIAQLLDQRADPQSDSHEPTRDAATVSVSQNSELSESADAETAPSSPPQTVSTSESEPVGTKHDEVDEPVCAAEASPTEDGSLASLIGQLLVLQPKDRMESQEQVSDSASTTASQNLSTDAESVGSDAAVSKPSSPLQTVTPLASEAAVSKPSSPSQTVTPPASDEESGKAQHHSVRSDTATPALKQKSGKKALNNRLLAQQAQAAWAFEAAQYQMAQHQMAQCHMAQWQMAQWQAAQMAQWQHASQIQAWQHDADPWQESYMI